MRLFVALWPPPAPRAALAAWAGQWQWPPTARRTSVERLHMTLHFLGDVLPQYLSVLVQALQPPAVPRAFECGPGRAEVWRNGVAAWCPAEPPAALCDLHAAIGESLLSAGFKLETRPWRPHVTLARAAAGARPPAQPLHWSWPVQGWVLVESVSGAGGGYRILERYRCS